MTELLVCLPPNASGKSTLLDLSFCLFDVTSRTTRHSVLNNKKNNFYCKVNFEVGGLDYFIERKNQKGGKRDECKSECKLLDD